MQAKRQYRYYDLMMAAFVTVLVCSNLIGPAKVAQIELGPFGVFGMDTLTFGAGIMFFPISFIFGDILTEVYGYANSRRVIWAGFLGLAFASFMAWVIVALPPAPFWDNQHEYEVAFGSAWRVSLACLVAFAAGEFVNSYIMAKMKIWTAGRHLWGRMTGSTIFGEGVDTVLFFPLAFYGTGVIPDDQIWYVVWIQFVAKVAVEVAFMPITYKIVAWLKRAENEDYYDRNTDFNPFSMKGAE